MLKFNQNVKWVNCVAIVKKYQYMKYKNPSNILTKISLTRYLNLKAFFETLEEI